MPALNAYQDQAVVSDWMQLHVDLMNKVLFALLQ